MLVQICTVCVSENASSKIYFRLNVANCPNVKNIAAFKVKSSRESEKILCVDPEPPRPECRHCASDETLPFKFTLRMRRSLHTIFTCLFLFDKTLEAVVAYGRD